MTTIKVSKPYTLTGHKDSIYALERSKSSHQFFSAGSDGYIVQWDMMKDTENGQLIAEVPNSVYAMHYFEDKNILVVGQNNEGIHFIDVGLKKEVGSLKLHNAAIFDIKSFGNTLFVASGDGTIFIVDMETLAITHKLSHTSSSARTIALNIQQQEFTVGYSDNMLRVFDMDDKSLKHEKPSHKKSIFAVKYSPDYKWLLSGGRDAHLNIWDVQNGYQLKQSIVAHMYAINHIAYGANGKYFVTCSMDKSIKVWDSETFKLIKVIDKARHAGHGNSVNKLLWTDHRNLLVSCSDDRAIAIWDLTISK